MSGSEKVAYRQESHCLRTSDILGRARTVIIWERGWRRASLFKERAFHANSFNLPFYELQFFECLILEAKNDGEGNRPAGQS